MPRSCARSGPVSVGLTRILAVLAVVSIPMASWAAPGSSGTGRPPITTNDIPGKVIVPQRSIPQAVQIGGVVHDASGQALAGVRIKLFSNGVSVESTTSGPDGTFSIDANPMSGANHTSDLWFESPDREAFLDQNVVLSAGSMAREHGLFPACTPQVDLRRNAANLDVTLFSQNEKKAAVRESKCLESGTGR